MLQHRAEGKGQGTEGRGQGKTEGRGQGAGERLSVASEEKVIRD